ncbi:MAG: alpha/beta hydrolase [Ketobacteraceae bacterium]|nr:alpha/beta hydrolase [Ketobacteraceae bacterium]
MEATPISHTLRNGLKIAGLCWGDSSLPKLLACHGWLDNAATYERLAPRLAEKFQVVAMDFAGHGLSDHRPRGVRYHLLDNVDDVILFADALGWEKFHLMGHSMGAGISTYVTSCFPDRVESLALIEGVGTHSTPPEEAPKVLRKAVKDMERAPDIRKPVYKNLDAAVKARTSVVGVISAAAAEPLCRRGTVPADADHLDKGITWSSDPRLKMTSALRLTEPLVQAFVVNIKRPVVFIGGEQGFGSRMPAINERLAVIADLHQVFLPGNHHLHLEPDTCGAVADALLAFYDNQLGSGL